MGARFILEGEWTGYTSAQRRVVHREVVTAKRAEKLKDLRAIIYTDGTSLILRLRKAGPREWVEPIDSYGELIRRAEAKGAPHVFVADL